MPTVTSAAKSFRGTVHLPERLTFRQVAGWREAVSGLAGMSVADVAADDAAILAILPALCAIIERCDVEGMPEHPTPDTWPATPRADAGLLIAQLIIAVTKIVAGEDERPN